MTNGERSQADRDTVDPILPRPFAVRVWRWALLGVVAITALLVVGIVRSGLPVPAPQAGIPAGPTQPAGGQPAGGGAAQPGGAAGGGQQQGDDQGGGVAQPGGEQPGGAIPADCLVPGDKIVITLEKARWSTEAGDVGGAYDITLVNKADKPICVFEHYTSQNSRSDPELNPPNAWSTACFMLPEAGPVESPGLLDMAEFYEGEYASDCYFEYTDKILAVYWTCSEALQKRLHDMSPEQRGSIMDSDAWGLPMTDEAKGFSCH